jgi:hypothetical protein
MPEAGIQETINAISFKRQADAATMVANAADYWRVLKSNEGLVDVDPQTEDNSADIGKGHEFAEDTYKMAKMVSIPFESYNTSQMLAWLFAFAFGSAVKTTPAAGAYTYTCVPPIGSLNGFELPYFTFVEQVRPGGSAVLDSAFIGCSVASFELKANKGLGRQNSTFSMNIKGTGKESVGGSGIVVPAALATTGLNVGDLALTVNGINYISQNRIEELTFRWDNAPTDDGYRPGSGTQDGFHVAGKIERGAKRLIGLNIKAVYPNGATDIALLKAQTEGTASLVWQGPLITGSTYHRAEITGHRTVISAAKPVALSGKVGIDVNVTFKYHATNGLVTAAVTTNQDNIFAVAA